MTRLYKSIAEVFEKRFDLTSVQKNELIKLCYNAARYELDTIATERRESEFKTATIRRDK